MIPRIGPFSLRFIQRLAAEASPRHATDTAGPGGTSLKKSAASRPLGDRCSPHSCKMRSILSDIHCAKYGLLEIRGLSYPMPFSLRNFLDFLGSIPHVGGGGKYTVPGPGQGCASQAHQAVAHS